MCIAHLFRITIRSTWVSPPLRIGARPRMNKISLDVRTSYVIFMEWNLIRSEIHLISGKNVLCILRFRTLCSSLHLVFLSDVWFFCDLKRSFGFSSSTLINSDIQSSMSHIWPRFEQVVCVVFLQYVKFSPLFLFSLLYWQKFWRPKFLLLPVHQYDVLRFLAVPEADIGRFAI